MRQYRTAPPRPQGGRSQSAFRLRSRATLALSGVQPDLRLEGPGVAPTLGFAHLLCPFRFGGKLKLLYGFPVHFTPFSTVTFHLQLIHPAMQPITLGLPLPALTKTPPQFAFSRR